MNDLNTVWIKLLTDILTKGVDVAPRGKRTKELPQHTIVVDSRRSVLTLKERKLNYQFMVAEAYWILSGDNRVETIAPWNSKISEFSDDGVTFFGAYGPKIAEQLPYVVEKLREDPNSRQAGLTLWRENPPATKDVPCTVALFFSVRNAFVNCHAFMRSNDAWLGTPYDVFNFSMLTHLVASQLHGTSPGRLHLTAASSHLYEPQWELAVDLINTVERDWYRQSLTLTPGSLWFSPEICLESLEKLRHTKPGSPLRWWEHE